MENITRNTENPFYFNVTSRKNKSVTYQVDTSIGTCTCPQGANGKGCAHQAAIALMHGGGNLNFIPQSAQERHRLAILAIGNNPQLDVNRFTQLNEKLSSTEELNNESKIMEENADIPLENNNTHDNEERQQQQPENEVISLKDLLKLHKEVAADIEMKVRNEDNNFKRWGVYSPPPLLFLLSKKKMAQLKMKKVIVTRPTYAFMYELRNGVYRRNAKMKKNNELKYFSSLKIHRKN